MELKQIIKENWFLILLGLIIGILLLNFNSGNQTPLYSNVNYMEGGALETEISNTYSLQQTLNNYFRGWEKGSTQIGAEWTSFTKDLGGDLSKFYSSNCYKFVNAHNSGCVVKTEFVARKSGWSSGGKMVTTQFMEMSGNSGWKAQALKYITVPGDGEYDVSATTCVDSCPSGVNDPTGGACFSKSTTVTIGQACNVGSKCGEVYVESVCKNDDVYSKFEVWNYNSDCDCVFDSYWYDLDKRCSYGCSENAAGASCDQQPPCTVGSECDKNYVGKVCKNDDVHKNYDIYTYNSNCNCVHDSYSTEFYKNCDYGCSNGVCESGPGPGPDCTDECSYTGEINCEFPISFECGNFDADDCKEWSEGDIRIGKCGVECKSGVSCVSGYKCVDYKCEEIAANTCEDYDYLTSKPNCPSGETAETIKVGDLTCYTGICIFVGQTCEDYNYLTNAPFCPEGENPQTITRGNMMCYTGECEKEGEDYTWVLIGGVIFVIIILSIIYFASSKKNNRGHYPPRRPYYPPPRRY